MATSTRPPASVEPVTTWTVHCPAGIPAPSFPTKAAAAHWAIWVHFCAEPAILHRPKPESHAAAIRRP